ncbi:MAG: hypothetical protein AAGA68_21650 [Pseudomonadota bacterium]
MTDFFEKIDTRGSEREGRLVRLDRRGNAVHDTLDDWFGSFVASIVLAPGAALLLWPLIDSLASLALAYAGGMLWAAAGYRSVMSTYRLQVFSARDHAAENRALAMACAQSLGWKPHRNNREVIASYTPRSRGTRELVTMIPRPGKLLFNVRIASEGRYGRAPFQGKRLGRAEQLFRGVFEEHLMAFEESEACDAQGS